MGVFRDLFPTDSTFAIFISYIVIFVSQSWPSSSLRHA
jgi:hypothetical protein